MSALHQLVGRGVDTFNRAAAANSDVWIDEQSSSSATHDAAFSFVRNRARKSSSASAWRMAPAPSLPRRSGKIP